MSKFTIGKADIEVDIPSFVELKLAWGYIKAAQGSIDPMDSITSILTLVAIGTVGAPDLPEGKEEREAELATRTRKLEGKMKPAEMAGLRTSLNELLIDIGLATRPSPGEVAPAGAVVSPSTATSTPSSAPSSPD